ncbi:MAG: hypothetical protein KUG56_02640 [Kordiimonadaceae bacterium]|nr:hypothetical protein [Kordiimonadaceae bacterium]
MKHTTALAVALICALAASPLSAVQNSHHASPYKGQENRGIKALSADRIVGLEAGKGLGFAKAAELNGLPGPKHVLELKEELALSAKQEAKIMALFQEMKVESIALGQQLIAQEKALEQFFQTTNMAEDEMEKLVANAASTRGKLRATHLKFHQRTPAILTRHQMMQYQQLRGYGKGGNTHHHS